MYSSSIFIHQTWNLMHLPSAAVADRDGDGNLGKFDKWQRQNND